MNKQVVATILRHEDSPLNQSAVRKYQRICEDFKNYDTLDIWRKQEIDRLISSFDTGTTVTNGVVRWNSNGHVPPKNVLFTWVCAKKKFSLANSLKAAKVDTDKFLSEYWKNPPQLSEDKLAEMRGAFGKGTKLVDVITGKTIQL